MNAPHKLPRGADLPNKRSAHPFRYRTVDCDECGGQGGITYPEAAGYVTHRCDDCDHTGEVDAACADCLVVRPLDDEGFCEPCAMASELPHEEWLRRYGSASQYGLVPHHRLHRVVQIRAGVGL